MRCPLARQQIQCAVAPELDVLHPVLEARQLRPRARRAAQIMREVPAVAIGHAGEDGLAVFARVQFDLRDAREVLPGFIPVLVRRRAELVKINLLEKVQVRRRPFARVRIARVINAAPVRVPRHAPAAGGILHARNHVAQFPARGRLEEMQRAILAPVFGERHRDELPVTRGHEPVHRRRAVGVIAVGIKHRPLVVRPAALERAQRDQRRLLRRRLEPQREHCPRAGDQAGVIRRSLFVKFLQLLRQQFAHRQLVQMVAGEFVLRLRPRAHRRVGGILQPLKIIRHLHAVIFVRHGPARRGRIIGGGQRCRRQRQKEKTQGAQKKDRFHVRHRVVTPQGYSEPPDFAHQISAPAGRTSSTRACLLRARSSMGLAGEEAWASWNSPLRGRRAAAPARMTTPEPPGCVTVADDRSASRWASGWGIEMCVALVGQMATGTGDQPVTGVPCFNGGAGGARILNQGSRYGVPVL